MSLMPKIVGSDLAAKSQALNRFGACQSAFAPCSKSDEKTSACSWLAECAEKPTCACVKRVLGPACQCDATSSGIKVACE